MTKPTSNFSIRISDLNSRGALAFALCLAGVLLATFNSSDIATVQSKSGTGLP
jgi:hypothetical protein